MSLNKRTYSPMSSTYSPYSTTLSPSYSYSRVTSYMDALERDETISTLRKELTNVKSIEMKHQSLLQEIAIAEKENRLIESKNEEIEAEYLERIKRTQSQVLEMERQLERIAGRVDQEEVKASGVEAEVNQLLEELKSLKREEETLQKQNQQLEQSIKTGKEHLILVAQESKQISSERSSLHETSKLTTQGMEESLKKLQLLSEQVDTYQKDVDRLKKQLSNFQIQRENLRVLSEKNESLIENERRKIKIQQSENAVACNELQNLNEELEKSSKRSQAEKDALYQNIVAVFQKSAELRHTMSEIDELLENDSTSKKYLKDISVKDAKLSGQNQKMRDTLNSLQSSFDSKKSEQIKMIEQLKSKLSQDLKLKEKIDARDKVLLEIISQTGESQL